MNKDSVQIGFIIQVVTWRIKFEGGQGRRLGRDISAY